MSWRRLPGDLALFHTLLGRRRRPPRAMPRSCGNRPGRPQPSSRRIRGGGFDRNLDELSDLLREHVRRKLDVARPGYDDAS